MTSPSTDIASAQLHRLDQADAVSHRPHAGPSAANELDLRRDSSVADETLLYAWRAGDHKAGGVLFARHVEALRRYFRRRMPHEADDLVQQTMLASVERREQVPTAVAFRAYLFGIARKVLLSHLRRNEVRRRKAPLLTEPDPASPDPREDMLAQERASRLLRELGRLPVELQRTTRFFYWDEHKLVDISHEMGVPTGTVKSRMHTVKRLLRTRVLASA
ncbi:MAG: sigma-70 family RNA polymerase sigma factor [Myxococcales bacterium FL481]|nr:MAG: sigma-70 family RNA polymerase sigma factor [Myxococcales bacterium FL481]